MKTRNIVTIVLAVGLMLGLFYLASNMINQGNTENEDLVENKNEVNNNENIDKDNQNTSNDNDKEKFIVPNFTLKDLEGNNVSLKDYRGKTVFLNFWAMSCPYCLIEMPDLNKLYLENKDKDFIVLAVNVGEPSKDVKAFIDDKGYKFPVLLDTTAEVAIEYRVTGIPTSFIIDKEGALKKVIRGAISYKEMKELLRAVK